MTLTLEFQQANSNGERFLLIQTFYDQSSSSDKSGLKLYTGTGSSYEKVGKMMIGHYISSKMIVMPGKDWKIQGICSTSCLSNDQIATGTEVRCASTCVNSFLPFPAVQNLDECLSLQCNYSQIGYNCLCANYKTNLCNESLFIAVRNAKERVGRKSRNHTELSERRAFLRFLLTSSFPFPR